jgi:ATP-dependent DNA ligase
MTARRRPARRAATGSRGAAVPRPPFPPMEAVVVDALPEGPGWRYEPKWDGFRCLAFKDGASVHLQSKAGKPLARYFPEAAAAVGAVPADGFVLDGEIVIPVGKGLSFDALLQRIHPAASRIARLATETPALYVVFDLLAEGGEPLVDLPLAERRRRLEAFARRHLAKAAGIRLSPSTDSLTKAKRWLGGTGETLDGVVAKPASEPYRSGERAMAKVKRMRTADCVVGGFRYVEGTKNLGSLLLGLHDEAGLLHHVGFTSGFPASERGPLARRLEALAGGVGFSGHAPGGPSRWTAGEEKPWTAVRPRLVCEVRYDHWSSGRFRHGTRFLRWRPDKAPSQCTLEQVESPGAANLALLRRGQGRRGQGRRGQGRRGRARRAGGGGQGPSRKSALSSGS